METTLLDPEREQKTFDWVLKCIDSCFTPEQIEASRRLIDYFEEKFGKGEAEGKLILALGLKDNQINYR